MKNGKAKQRVLKLWYINSLKENSSRNITHLEFLMFKYPTCEELVSNKIFLLLSSSENEKQLSSRIDFIKSKFGGYPYFWLDFVFFTGLLATIRSNYSK